MPALLQLARVTSALLSGARYGYLYALLATLFLYAPGNAIDSATAPSKGIRANNVTVHALVDARIVTAPGRVIEEGTVVLRDGVIAAVGTGVEVPADARVWDCAGLSIYPGLIESHAHVGLPAAGEEGEAAGPGHWNPYVRAQVQALELYAPGEEDLQKLRKLGFTAALLVPRQGLFHGTSDLVSLGNASGHVVRRQVAQHLVLKAMGKYPQSLMGAIALARQTFLDAQWYGNVRAAYAKKPEAQALPQTDRALEALASVVEGEQPLAVEADDELALLRAAQLADEFGLELWVRGSGREYRQLELIKAVGAPLFLPLNFPPPPRVDDPEAALAVDLAVLQHWEAAAENAALLHRAGVPFALTSATLKKPADFPQKVRQAIERGLPKEAALAALTTIPAEWLGVADRLGTVEVGKLAHLVVAEGELFDEESKVCTGSA